MSSAGGVSAAWAACRGRGLIGAPALFARARRCQSRRIGVLVARRNIGAFELERQPTDETNPVLTLPDDVTQEATGPDGAAVAFQVSATDETGPTSPGVGCTKEGDPPVAISSGETSP